MCQQSSVQFKWNRCDNALNTNNHLRTHMETFAGSSKQIVCHHLEKQIWLNWESAVSTPKTEFSLSGTTGKYSFCQELPGNSHKTTRDIFEIPWYKWSVTNKEIWLTHTQPKIRCVNKSDKTHFIVKENWPKRKPLSKGYHLTGLPNHQSATGSPIPGLMVPEFPRPHY